MSKLGYCVAVLVLTGACKGKESKSTEGPSSAAPGSAAPGSAATEPKPTEPVPPPNIGLIKAGPAPAFGCFAWSATAKAAACVAGNRGTNDATLGLVILDGKTLPTKLLDSIDGPTAATTNTMLANGGYTAIAGEVKPLTPGASLDLGKGVSLKLTAKQTKKGGPNEPPTNKHVVTAKCASGETKVLEDEAEGGDSTVNVRVLGDHAIVEKTMHYALEGETGDTFDAAVLDMAACKVAAVGK